MAKALAAHRGAEAPFGPECQQDLFSVASCIPQPLLPSQRPPGGMRRLGWHGRLWGGFFPKGDQLQQGQALRSAFAECCERSVGSRPARHLTQPRPRLLCVKKAAADAPELSCNEHVPLP